MKDLNKQTEQLIFDGSILATTSGVFLSPRGLDDVTIGRDTEPYGECLVQVVRFELSNPTNINWYNGLMDPEVGKDFGKVLGSKLELPIPEGEMSTILESFKAWRHYFEKWKTDCVASLTEVGGDALAIEFFNKFPTHELPFQTKELQDIAYAVTLNESVQVALNFFIKETKDFRTPQADSIQLIGEGGLSYQGKNAFDFTEMQLDVCKTVFNAPLYQGFETTIMEDEIYGARGDNKLALKSLVRRINEKIKSDLGVSESILYGTEMIRRMK